MLISVAEYESMLETLDILGDDEALADLRQSREDFAADDAFDAHLMKPFDGYHSARRGTYRIICRINEDKHTVEIHSIRHRRDSYRT